MGFIKRFRERHYYLPSFYEDVINDSCQKNWFERFKTKVRIMKVYYLYMSD